MPPFQYTLVRSSRRTIGIRVTAEGAVVVAAPSDLPHAYIEQVVRSKTAWVRDRLNHYSEMRTQGGPKTYQNGEPLSYLGRKLRLRLIEGEAGAARLHRGSIHVPVPDSLTAKDRRQHIIWQLTTWYQTRALCHLQRQSACFAGKLGVRPALVGIKSYRSHWGSCHADGRIYFNWRIILAPPRVVRYVVVHELCHLIHHNHSHAFWAQVETALSDFRKARDWLRVNGFMLHMASPA